MIGFVETGRLPTENPVLGCFFIKPPAFFDKYNIVPSIRKGVPPFRDTLPFSFDLVRGPSRLFDFRRQRNNFPFHSGCFPSR